MVFSIAIICNISATEMHGSYHKTRYSKARNGDAYLVNFLVVVQAVSIETIQTKPSGWFGMVASILYSFITQWLMLKRQRDALPPNGL